MKTFEKQAAQGDVLFTRVKDIPQDVTKALPDLSGRVIVAHSETGHHHAFPTGAAVELFTTKNPLICYLRVSGNEAVALKHLRPFDTHESIAFNPGCYEVRRQREWTPEGWARMVAD